MKIGKIPKNLRKRWNMWRDYYYNQLVSQGAKVESIEQISETLVKITIIPTSVKPKRRATPTQYQLYGLVPPYIFTVYTNKTNLKQGQIISGDLAYKLLTQY